jgi:hypothetical protein
MNGEKIIIFKEYFSAVSLSVYEKVLVFRYKEELKLYVGESAALTINDFLPLIMIGSETILRQHVDDLFLHVDYDKKTLEKFYCSLSKFFIRDVGKMTTRELIYDTKCILEHITPQINALMEKACSK